MTTPTPSARAQIKIWYCEKQWKCGWQGFALHQGLGWGEIPSETNEWLRWHRKHCGGKLIDALLQSATEARQATWKEASELAYQHVVDSAQGNPTKWPKVMALVDEFKRRAQETP